ncbi:MAG: hypothetical protein ACXWTH_06945 [Methylosarcina sp.]
MAKQGISPDERAFYHKWLRFYLDFCNKYRLEPADQRNFAAFDQKLSSKNQSESQRKQARRAIEIYYRGIADRGMMRVDKRTEIINPLPAVEARSSDFVRSEVISAKQFAAKASYTQNKQNAASKVGLVAEPIPYGNLHSNGTATEEMKLTGADWIWVYDKLAAVIKIRHYSPKTL